MKTIKRIADELGITKQRVYRFIRKNHIIEAYHEANADYFSEADESRIKSHFMKNDRIIDAPRSESNDTLIDMLLKQLEVKDAQINRLSEALRAEQMLHAEANRLLIAKNVKPSAADKFRGIFRKKIEEN